MTVTFRAGRLPAQPARPHLRLGSYTGALPAPPASADRLSRVSSWPMYGNDVAGDCTFAEVGHAVQSFTTYGQGVTVTVTDQDVLGGYEALTGYRPGEPSTDRGAYIQDVLGYWRKTGIGGHRIVAYAAVDVADLTAVRQAINLFGGLSIGMNVPASAVDQFHAGQTWDVVKGSRNEGGHCIFAGAYGPGWLDGITWGRRQRMTEAFWRAYVDEAWAALTLDQLSAAGLDPQGLTLFQLGQDLAALTGGPNPIPQPTPIPTPTPTPVPAGATGAEVGAAIRQALAGLGV